jgi:RNA polymerase sigma-70 factor (ECF subfamily)
MADLPVTRSSLLLRLRDLTDADAWREFARVYGPVVYHYGRKRGLQDADAEDLTQSVLQAVADAIGRLDYDRERGSFRGWLFTLAHRKLCDLKARRRRQAQGTGDSDVQAQLNAHPATADDEALWQREYEKRLFDWAAEQAKGEFQEATWRAFWLTGVERRSGQDAAEALGMSVAAVYVAKSRVLARLRELVEQLEGE